MKERKKTLLNLLNKRDRFFGGVNVRHGTFELLLQYFLSLS